MHAFPSRLSLVDSVLDINVEKNVTYTAVIVLPMLQQTWHDFISTIIDKIF